MKTIKQTEIEFWTEKLANELKNGNEYEINEAEHMLKVWSE